jgi:hypothetical protein
MPSTRGVWLDAASGQMLRQMPGAVMNVTGSSGMTTFHMTNRPVSGTATSSPATTSAATRLPARMSRQALTDSRLGIWV